MGGRVQAIAAEPVQVVEPEAPPEVETASAPPATEEFEFDYEMTQQWTPPLPQEETETVEEEVSAEQSSDAEPSSTAVEEEAPHEVPVEEIGRASCRERVEIAG